MDSYVLAVSGNLGSGKTTLATALARSLGAELVSSSVYERSYIRDQIETPERWSFEAQLSFLIRKYEGFRRALSRAPIVVVDRALSEEVEVFARYWHGIGAMDDRAFETYLSCAQTLSATIPSPTLVAYCQCSVEECKRRMKLRPRDYQMGYAPNHLAEIGRLSEEWRMRQTCAVVSINTEEVDVRRKSGFDSVMSSLAEAVAPENSQLLLFDNPAGRTGSVGTSLLLKKLQGRSPTEHVKTGVRIYVAAPFTDIAELERGDGTERLFELSAEHGVLPNRYRDSLNHISAEMKQAGFEVILPHRDINQWGARRMSPAEVVRETFSAVEQCDVFFGILGHSFGSHMEAGLAAGLRRAMILVQLEDQPDTFIGRGLAQSSAVVTITIPTLDRVPQLLTRTVLSSLVDEAIQRGHDLFNRESQSL